MAINPGKTALFLAFKIKKTELLPVFQMNPAKSTVKNPHENNISVFQCRSLGRANTKAAKERFLGLAVKALRMCKDHVTKRQAWGPGDENLERRNGGRLGEARISSGVRVKARVGVTWQSFSAFKLILRKFLLLSCLKAEKWKFFTFSLYFSMVVKQEVSTFGFL